MGYPTEIPNSMPERRPVPLENPIARFLRRLLEAIRAPFRRRRTTLAQHPERYRQGIDRTAPRFGPGDARAMRHADPRALLAPRPSDESQGPGDLNARER